MVSTREKKIQPKKWDLLLSGGAVVVAVAAAAAAVAAVAAVVAVAVAAAAAAAASLENAERRTIQCQTQCQSTALPLPPPSLSLRTYFITRCRQRVASSDEIARTDKLVKPGNRKELGATQKKPTRQNQLKVCVQT